MVIDTAYQHLQLRVPKLFKLDIIIFILQASKWGENKTQSLIKIENIGTQLEVKTFKKSLLLTKILLFLMHMKHFVHFKVWNLWQSCEIPCTGFILMNSVNWVLVIFTIKSRKKIYYTSLIFQGCCFSPVCTVLIFFFFLRVICRLIFQQSKRTGCRKNKIGQLLETQLLVSPVGVAGSKQWYLKRSRYN